MEDATKRLRRCRDMHSESGQRVAQLDERPGFAAVPDDSQIEPRPSEEWSPETEAAAGAGGKPEFRQQAS